LQLVKELPKHAILVKHIALLSILGLGTHLFLKVPRPGDS